MSDSNQGHVCSACGGTGGTLNLPDIDSRSKALKRRGAFICSDCLYQSTFDPRIKLYSVPFVDTTGACVACGEPFAFCPICHGSGRISDVMPVADALVDAEARGFNDRDTGHEADPPLQTAERKAYLKGYRRASRAVPGLRG